ncbi:hypothetical protein ACVXG8_25605 [Escherichia coli]
MTYIGPDGAGHYVKMVHNGIEYGDMQLIAEAYSLLKGGLNLSNEELAETFTEWNKGELNSYLIDITKDIFTKKDEEGKYLVDVILDEAANKGTGKWTSQSSLSTGRTAVSDHRIRIRSLHLFSERSARCGFQSAVWSAG